MKTIKSEWSVMVGDHLNPGGNARFLPAIVSYLGARRAKETVERPALTLSGHANARLIVAGREVTVELVQGPSNKYTFNS